MVVSATSINHSAVVIAITSSAAIVDCAGRLCVIIFFQFQIVDALSKRKMRTMLKRIYHGRQMGDQVLNLMIRCCFIPGLVGISHHSTSLLYCFDINDILPGAHHDTSESQQRY